MKLKHLTSKQWREYLSQCNIGHIYNDPRWLDLIEAVYPGLNILRLVCTTDSDDPMWLLPLVEIKPIGKRKSILISLPFANYGGFILPSCVTSAEMEKIPGFNERQLLLIEEFIKSTRADIIEIREMDKPGSGAAVHTFYQRFEILLPEDPEIIWDSVLSGNARTSVRKADREGISVSFDKPDRFDVFQKLNAKNAAFHGTPVHSGKWFTTLFRLFPGETHIAIARYKNQDIGAALVLCYGNRAMLHSLTPDPKFRHLPVSDKIVWECLKFVIVGKSVEIFDFGRTRPNEGQLFFKRKWGGEAKPIYYCYFNKSGASVPEMDTEKPMYATAVRIWRCLPLFLTRLIGPFFRIRIPS